jgi:hypothetical protein
MSWSYKIALAVDCISIIVALYFLVSDGLKYRDVSHNGSLALVTLGICAWVGISYFLYHHGSPRIGSAMAWIPAIPLIGYGLFVLLFIIFKPDMR